MSYDLHRKRQLNAIEENHQMQQENDMTEGKPIGIVSWLHSCLEMLPSCMYACINSIHYNPFLYWQIALPHLSSVINL